MSSRSRACDTCHLRKTRCVREDGKERCVLCTFHDLNCTFARRPTPRRHQQRQRRAHGHGHRQQQEAEENLLTPVQTFDAVQAQSHQTQEFEVPDRQQVSPVLSQAETSTTASHPNEQVRISTPPAAAYPSILKDTLGLDPTTHAEYVGSTDYRDPILLDLRCSDSVRRINDRTLFLIHPDEHTTSEARRIADVDSVEAAVHPVGHILVDLYFRFVHPSFPILHKDVFIAKHQISHRHFAPSLLTAVYLLALDWQLHDSLLASGGIQRRPDAAALERLAEATLEEDMRRPKLEWEIGLRRRLGWALYMQDLWAAFVYGRPLLLHNDDWDVRPCSSSDFPEYAKEEEDSATTTTTTTTTGSVPASTGWLLFLRHIELSHILREIMCKYYTTAATRRDGSLDNMGVVAAVDLAKPIIARLRQWQATLPDELSFTASASQPRRPLCASASLHLAYHAVIIALYRALVRLLTPGDPTPPSLHAAVRTAARDKVQAAVELLGSMQPEHTAAFWGSAASHQVAMIGGFAGLLWATAETAEEMAWCAARVEDLKWALKVRGAGAPFARQALRLLEREIGGLTVDYMKGPGVLDEREWVMEQDHASVR
ncbi:putative transcriptional activator protein dal81 protein [Eutypa lata UCREL1]|uniref:Putative transcriptional activator protein dal81 protein n=1 Tax=Eutypa lata (strain UCR-EL1) TaxID=1287681 RepID=M7S6Z8_EUTLA|nr:putative transcriptional activator protein dal81 protein [Eutypa lata UCREL1]